MKPTEYLKQLEVICINAEGKDKEVAKAIYEGAVRMYEFMANKDRDYRDNNREKIREYNAEYMRNYRAKKRASNGR